MHTCEGLRSLRNFYVLSSRRSWLLFQIRSDSTTVEVEENEKIREFHNKARETAVKLRYTEGKLGNRQGKGFCPAVDPKFSVICQHDYFK